jgi:hypothetical protein
MSKLSSHAGDDSGEPEPEGERDGPEEPEIDLTDIKIDLTDIKYDDVLQVKVLRIPAAFYNAEDDRGERGGPEEPEKDFRDIEYDVVAEAKVPLIAGTNYNVVLQIENLGLSQTEKPGT